MKRAIAVAVYVEKCRTLLRRFRQCQVKQGFFAVWIHRELIVRVAPGLLRVRLGQGDAFGLEGGFRFVLPAFGLIARPPPPAIAPVMARLVSEDPFQGGTPFGKIPPGVIRALEFGAEQGAEKQIGCLHRRAVCRASEPAICFTQKFVQDRERFGRSALPKRDN